MIEPIGKAFTCYKEKFGIPRQSGLVPSSTGIIKLNFPFSKEEALRGLETFSHLIISFMPHQAEFRKLSVRPPRLGGNQKMGVFATRSPFRPNPICSSIVELNQVNFTDGEILFSNHDILDGSPVLDIKPYIPEWDSFPCATNGWLKDSPLPAKKLVNFKEEISLKDKEKELIREILSLDPRPSYQKGVKDYAFKILEYDVHFSYTGANKILVTNIQNLKIDSTK